MALGDSDNPKQTYKGSCHCGAVFYTVTLPSLTSPTPRHVILCDCTNCAQHGLLLTHTARKNFNFTRGVDKLQGYAYGTGQFPLRWCGDCGVPVGFIKTLEGEVGEEEHMAISVRAIHDLDLDSLPVKKWDGLATGKPWVKPTE